MKHLEEWINAKREVRSLYFVLFLLSFLLVLCLYFLLFKRQVVIYMPPYKITIGGDKYLLLWASFFSLHLGNPTRESLKVLSPFLSLPAKIKLKEEVNYYEKNSSSREFIPLKTKIQPPKIIVEGILRLYVGSEILKEEKKCLVMTLSKPSDYFRVERYEFKNCR